MNRHQLLQVALVAFGAVFCLVLPLSMVWPSGWSWHAGPPSDSQYFMMIVAIYATLGIFLILAARDPAAHRSLIAFTIWSSLAHALVMAVQAFDNPMHRGHLLGDVPALLLVAIVLGALIYAEPRPAAAVA